MEAMYTYDAVKLYAMAADEVLKKNGNIRNGTDIVQTIIQMGKYKSDIQGVMVNMDKNADSEGTNILLAMVNDTKCPGSTRFEQVAHFVVTNDSAIPVSKAIIPY